MKTLFIATALACATASLAPAQTQPATAPAAALATAPAIDPQLWTEMKSIDEKVGHIFDLRADFEQKKYTPLLKKPLVSTGSVAVKGPRTLWTTQRPEPTVMLMDGREIRLYYPKQAAVEIYPIAGKLGELAASPLPRLEVLREFFSFERLASAELDAKGDDASTLALRLTPLEATLREHVQQVRVLLDRRSGYMLVAETLDTDDDRTVLTFSNVRANSGIKDEELRLQTPPNTTVSRPLDGLGSSPPPPPSRQGRAR